MNTTSPLFLVATPIGHLQDITLRAITTLKSVHIIACENRRHAQRLLSAHGIGTRTIAYHEHNATSLRPRLLSWLCGGRSVALISDAGTPLLSDPGFKLVREALEREIEVIPIPGASACLSALVASGLPPYPFYFYGFLPSKQQARRETLKGLSSVEDTLVFYESPHRLAETLADMVHVWPQRQGVVAREMTKMHEEFLRGPLHELVERCRALKGECVVLLEPLSREVPLERMRSLLAEHLESMTVRDAVDSVARACGVSKKIVYAQALSLIKTRDSL